MSFERVSQYKLGELAEITSSKRIFVADYVDEGIPFYRSKEIIQKSLGQEVDDILFISKKKYLEIKKRFGSPKDGDLLLSAVGERAGVPYVVNNDGDFYFKDGNLIWFRNIREQLNTHYLSYWLKSFEGQHTLRSIMIGSAQRALTIVGLKELKVSLPSLEKQNQIASILSSLDNKIELNRQTNQTLEAIAQALFKEWFVDFNFPGVTGEMEDTELGNIPKGWKVKKLTEELNIVYGKNLPTSKLLDNGYPVFGGNGQIGFYSEYLYEKPQVIVACRGAASGKVNQSLPCSYVTNNSLVFETSQKSTLNFHYLKFMCLNTDFTSFVSGSAQPQLTIESLKGVSIIVPDPTVLKEFGRVESDIEDKILNNNSENLTLTQIRDSLLPKLIKGEINVA